MKCLTGWPTDVHSIYSTIEKSLSQQKIQRSKFINKHPLFKRHSHCSHHNDIRGSLKLNLAKKTWHFEEINASWWFLIFVKEAFIHNSFFRDGFGLGLGTALEGFRRYSITGDTHRGITYSYFYFYFSIMGDTHRGNLLSLYAIYSFSPHFSFFNFPFIHIFLFFHT